MSDHPTGVAYPLGGVMVTNGIPKREPPDFRVLCTTHNSISIAASPLKVLTAFLDTNTQRAWNTFNGTAAIYYTPEPTPSDPDFPELSALFSRPGMLSPGCKFAESNNVKGGDLTLSTPKVESRNNVEVVSVEEFEGKYGRRSYRVVWKLIDWSPWLMNSRRTHEFVERDGGTEYQCWTELGGLFALAPRWTSGPKTMEKGLDSALVSLKKYLES